MENRCFFYQNVLGIDIILYDFEYTLNGLEYRNGLSKKSDWKRSF
jgi:hypothetical protein